MIPSVNDDLNNDFEIEEQPTSTYRLNLSTNRVAGSVNGLDAMAQVVYKILNTERYESPIYSWNYGVELADLFGQPIDFVYPELKRRITEALTQDERITSVENFVFKKLGSAVTVTFDVTTTEGDLNATKAVTI